MSLHIFENPHNPTASFREVVSKEEEFDVVREGGRTEREGWSFTAQIGEHYLGVLFIFKRKWNQNFKTST
jgi:hypothetical protein